MRQFLKKNLIAPLLAFLRQGISIRELALTISIATVLGIIPLLGVNSTLCFLLALYLRLNPGAMQIINWLLFPLQLLLYIPFIKLGAYMLGQETSSKLRIEYIQERFDMGFFPALQTLWELHLYGLIAWAIAGIPLAYLAYIISRHLLKRLKQNNIEEIQRLKKKLVK